jgi:hypothetical protein
VLLIGCGHRGTSSVAPAPAAAATTGAVALPIGPPLVTPGERMTYRMSLRGMEVAAYMIEVGEIGPLASRQAIVVQTHAKSTGIASMVTKLDDRYASWIDVQTGRPLRFQTDELETETDKELEHVVVELAGREGNVIPIAFRINNDPPTPEAQQVTREDVWDYNAFLIALRGWEAPVGATLRLEVFRSRHLWQIDVRVAGKTQLVTELGELPALRFDAHATKLDRNGGRFPSTPERDFSIWISDDDGRVPLQTTAATDYGDITMVIVDYQPGTAARLRR